MVSFTGTGFYPFPAPYVSFRWADIHILLWPWMIPLIDPENHCKTQSTIHSHSRSGGKENPSTAWSFPVANTADGILTDFARPSNPLRRLRARGGLALNPVSYQSVTRFRRVAPKSDLLIPWSRHAKDLAQTRSPINLVEQPRLEQPRLEQPRRGMERVQDAVVDNAGRSARSPLECDG